MAQQRCAGFVIHGNLPPIHLLFSILLYHFPGKKRKYFQDIIG